MIAATIKTTFRKATQREVNAAPMVAAIRIGCLGGRLDITPVDADGAILFRGARELTHYDDGGLMDEATRNAHRRSHVLLMLAGVYTPDVGLVRRVSAPFARPRDMAIPADVLATIED